MPTVKLLKEEQIVAQQVSTSTITFYSTTDASHVKTKAYIQERVDAIVHANPWLTGKLTTGWFNSNVTLEFNPESPPAVVVEEAHLPSLSPQIEYDHLVELCTPFMVVTGSSLINSDLPMFRVTWVTISDTQGALFFSVGHGVADGYTYYRLYGMLSGTTPVEALTQTRVEDYMSRANAAVKGCNDVVPLLLSFPFLVNMVGKLVLKPAPRRTIHTVNAKWIAQEKAKYKESSPVGYVSTNDIVTSWAFRAAKCDFGVMAVNFRGRVDGVDRTLGGNYEMLIGYQPEDYSTPALIRESLETNGYRRVRSGKFPSMWTGSSGVVSSWVTLYEPAELPGWTMVEHLPCVSGKSAFSAVIVFFKRTPTSVGVMLACHDKFNVDSDPALARQAAAPAAS
ncbi:unnamed protein product [Aphanomyces euteiches]|uniref:Condensation domain-containing protein n=1 Tax=Aphanomyces euteiches TaxID=100861 RepID=A0A6G0X490_9STRA|nr:hypothetical protein Ae201684_008602 [Aphanomyces euteiches]KAH9085952.1 hypothetical protein Ae201684P_005648 [Aphanomyces euteiches]